MFNKVTLNRRKMTIRGLADVKGAKERLEECQPNDEFLFGAELKELAKAMKEENQFKGKSFSEKPSFFQKKKNKFGSASGHNYQGKSDYSKSNFSKGKKA